MLIHSKDDIEFVTEFSCLSGHPVPIEIIYLHHIYNIYIRTITTLRRNLHCVYSATDM